MDIPAIEGLSEVEIQALEKNLQSWVGQEVTFLPIYDIELYGPPTRGTEAQRVNGMLTWNEQDGYKIVFHGENKYTCEISFNVQEARSVWMDVQLAGPEGAPTPSPVLAMQKAFADAALAQVPGEKLKRPELEAILRAALPGVSDADYQIIAALMEKGGVLPHSDIGERHIEGLESDQQNVLQNPDDLLAQCARLGYSAREVGLLLGLAPDIINTLNLAGVLINSGKAHLTAGLVEDLQKYPDRDVHTCIGILRKYEFRELDVLDVLREMNVPPNVVSILTENVRHDPSQLKNLEAKLLYYLLHCQEPSTGKLVPVETRILKATQDRPEYRPIHRGYKALNGRDLVDVHHETVAKIEEELTELLNENGYAFTDLKAFLNERFGFTPPVPQEQVQ